jgi:phage shock protein C
VSERLYRSVDDRMIAGVCGGLAERLDIDPSIIRIVWALLVLPTGFIAIAVYGVMWLVVPQAPKGLPRRARPMGRSRVGGRDGFTLFVGVAFILGGAWFLLRDLLPFLDPGRLWPVALVILGVGLIVWAYQRSQDDPWSHRP